MRQLRSQKSQKRHQKTTKKRQKGTTKYSQKALPNYNEIASGSDQPPADLIEDKGQRPAGARKHATKECQKSCPEV